MKPQPYKKALKHLDKAESFQDRLAAHMKEVRYILEKAGKEKQIFVKKNRKIK